MLKRLIEKYKEQTPTMQGFIVLFILLVIGIIIRWNSIIEGIRAGFEFFSTK